MKKNIFVSAVVLVSLVQDAMPMWGGPAVIKVTLPKDYTTVPVTLMKGSVVIQELGGKIERTPPQQSEEKNRKGN